MRSAGRWRKTLPLVGLFTVSLAVVGDTKLRKPVRSIQAVWGALWVEYSSIWHPIRAALRRPSPVLGADSLAELLTGCGGGGGRGDEGAWCS